MTTADYSSVETATIQCQIASNNLHLKEKLKDLRLAKETLVCGISLMLKITTTEQLNVIDSWRRKLNTLVTASVETALSFLMLVLTTLSNAHISLSNSKLDATLLMVYCSSLVTRTITFPSNFKKAQFCSNSKWDKALRSLTLQHQIHLTTMNGMKLKQLAMAEEVDCLSTEIICMKNRFISLTTTKRLIRCTS